MRTQKERKMPKQKTWIELSDKEWFEAFDKALSVLKED